MLVFKQLTTLALVAGRVVTNSLFTPNWRGLKVALTSRDSPPSLALAALALAAAVAVSCGKSHRIDHP